MPGVAVSSTIKKIGVADLRPGMFIADLGAGWMDHPFLRNSFVVKEAAIVAKIAASGIRELYIDTARGDDVRDAPTEDEVRAQLDSDMIRIASTAAAPRVAYREEASRALRVRAEADRVVHGVLNDVRLGRQVRIEQVEPVVEKMTQSILRNGSALLSLCRVKGKDDYTFLHSVSVCALLVSFCRAVGMSSDETRMAGIGGLLHDVGKVKTPDAILNKPDKLTDAEFDQMKGHVHSGYEVLSETEGIDSASILVAHQHHERHDGSGYPLGLKDGEISRIGQMAAICDVYDAITSDRCYHKGMAAHEALRKLLEWSKFHFNAELVQQFIRVIGIYPVGTLVQLESGRIALVHDQHEGGSLLQPVVRVIYDSKRRSYLPPKDVDLSKPLGHGGGDKILCHETPEKWGIDLARFAPA